MRKLSLLVIAPWTLVFAGAALARDPAKVEPPVVPEVVAVAPVEAVEPVDATGPAAVVEQEDVCGELFSEALPETIPATTAAPGACKTCKGRTWCKCTYNGLPRVSCNPCCYGAYGAPTVCFD